MSSRDDEPRWASNEELTAITGISRQSLRLWAIRGLLPKPTLFSDGKSGVRSRWPRSAIDRARFVMKMKGQGYELDEIADMVKERWPERGA